MKKIELFKFTLASGRVSFRFTVDGGEAMGDSGDPDSLSMRVIGEAEKWPSEEGLQIFNQEKKVVIERNERIVQMVFTKRERLSSQEIEKFWQGLCSRKPHDLANTAVR